MCAARAGRWLIAGVLLAACSPPDAAGGQSRDAAPPTWRTGPWTTACRFDARTLPEVSGLAPSVRHRHVLWAINDSGNSATVYALDTRTCAIRGRHAVDVRAVDWEALASGRNEAGQPVLWVGDIGDNLSSRDDVAVIEVPEPALGSTAGPGTVHRFRYPRGARDAEALMASADGTRLFVMSKALAGRTYQVPLTSGAATAEDIAGASGFVTDAARNPMTGDYAVRDYPGITRFRGPIPGQRLGRSNPPRQRQAEAVAFSRNGRWLFTASEGDGRLLRAAVR